MQISRERHVVILHLTTKFTVNIS